jgi:cytochrome c5
VRQRRFLLPFFLASTAIAIATAAALVRAQAPALTTGDLRHPQGTNAGILAFTGRCASCHDNGTSSAPDRYALNRLTP